MVKVRTRVGCPLSRLAAVIAMLSLVQSAAPLAAQEPWKASYFPYLLGNPSDGLMLIGRYQLTRNAPYFVTRNDDEIINPLSFAGAFSVEGGISAIGSRYLSGIFRAPGLANGWRFYGQIEARREARFGYYGLGPSGSLGAATPTGDEPANYFRVHRTRYVARGEVTRNLTGPLSLAVAGAIEHTRFSGLPGETLFGPGKIDGTDATARATVVLDTRDREFVPGKGILAEAGVYAGTDGTDIDSPNLDQHAVYTGEYFHIRGYISPREGTVVAARLAGRSLSQGAPLSARYTLPGWERDVSVLGGPETNRGVIRGRFAGRGVLLGSLEVRHDLLNAGDFGAVTLLAFADGGRVFEDPGFSLTTKNWEVGYGGGVALRILRSAVIITNFAGGPDGFSFSMGTGWAF